MLTESQCRKIIDFALACGQKLASKKKPLAIEVSLTGTNVATSRFANNEMTQNQAPSANYLSVRVLKSGRQARLDSLDLSSAGIEAMVKSAVKACDLLEAEDDLLPLPTAAKKSQSTSAVDRYHPPTVKLTALDRAREIGKIIALAEAGKVSAAGVYSSGENFNAIGNSNGLFRYYRETSAECSITVTDDGATSWVKAQSPRYGEVDGALLAERAIAKAHLARHPQDLTPGRYTAILEPAAVLDLLTYLWWDFSGTSHVDKLSCLLEKVGEKVFGDNITIVDDVGSAMQCGCPFDGEGVTRQSINLVDKGVVSALVHSRQSAQRLRNSTHAKTESTGHSLAQPSAMGEMPLNLVIEGGITSIEEMIQQVQGDQEAVLLTRVWYVREVDGATKLLTGMTRDGTFLVKDGAIVQPVRNLRFNVSLIDLLNNVIALGPSIRTAGVEGFPAIVPAMMVKNFNFTEGTRF